MYQMRSAMVDKDADSFASHIDFPSLRENLRAQLMTMMHAKLANSPDVSRNPFAGLGMMMAMGFVNQFIDTMVTPAGVMTMMAQGTAKPARAGAPRSAGCHIVSRTAGSSSCGYRQRRGAIRIKRDAQGRLFGTLQELVDCPRNRTRRNGRLGDVRVQARRALVLEADRRQSADRQIRHGLIAGRVESRTPHAKDMH
ncbi:MULTISPECIES: DUF2939 domain-containing protein [Burkholderia]|uniref:DUF2939 domain-containing protein n=1 Tax=Burkholderia TaxID=32008 RepID=UPI001F2D5138|nr:MULTISPECIES: DUF2939 domain-containing protein [Burkholderia]